MELEIAEMLFASVLTATAPYVLVAFWNRRSSTNTVQ